MKKVEVKVVFLVDVPDEIDEEQLAVRGGSHVEVYSLTDRKFVTRPIHYETIECLTIPDKNGIL